MARPSGRPLREELIVSAQTLIQQYGVTAFSYGDLAANLGIRAPSIHHHFRNKEDLVAEVAQRYRVGFAGRVAMIKGRSAASRLRSYALLFQETATDGSVCLCAAVAGDWMNVGDGPRIEVQLFIEEQTQWIASQITRGVELGEFEQNLDAELSAYMFFAGLEGATLLQRTRGNGPTIAELAELTLQLLRIK